MNKKKVVYAATLKVRGGVERDVYGKKAGKGALIQWEKSATIGVSQDQTLIVWREDESDRIGASPTRFEGEDSRRWHMSNAESEDGDGGK